MALRKPSEYFKKEKTIIDNSVQELVKMPELNTFSDSFESFKDNLSKIEILSEFSETLDNYRVNIDKVNYLSEKVEDIQTEVQTLLKKEDLDRAMMSQLIMVEQSIRDIQSKVKGINEKNLTEIRLDVSGLTENVNEFLGVEVPKYRKLVVDFEFRSNKRYEKLDKTLTTFDEKLDETVNDVIEKINLVEIINSSVEKKVTQKIEEVQNLQKLVNNELKNVEEHKGELIKKVTDLEVEILRNESHIKTQNEYIENIQEEVRGVISKLHIEELEEQNYELGKKVKYLEEVFEKFNSETLTEGLLNEPPEVKNEDSLTPLDKNFVTLDQLQDHYRLFINRIQQQLSTIGGGGETRLKYLDDIVGIATNASAYDGKFLKYNHGISKFEFVTVSGGGVTEESYWTEGIVGIVTTSNVGINTTNPTSALTVIGNALIVGIVTATDFNSASDIKLKENVRVIDNPLDKILKLEGVNFQWRETGKKSLGVIAQEVEKVLPELVSGDESKTVNYNGIIGLLIECVKEQQNEIDKLKRLIDK